MKKINKSDNTLIKRKNLISMLKKAGISRVSKEALEETERITKDYIDKMILFIKENMIVNGRKTLTREDVKKAVESIVQRGIKEESWEI